MDGRVSQRSNWPAAGVNEGSAHGRIKGLERRRLQSLSGKPSRSAAYSSSRTRWGFLFAGFPVCPASLQESPPFAHFLSCSHETDPFSPPGQLERGDLALLTSSRPGFFFFIRSTGEKMLSLTCDGEWAGSNPEDHPCHPRGLGLRMKPRLKKAEPRNGAITSRCLRTQVQLCLVLLYCSVPWADKVQYPFFFFFLI